MPDFQNAHFDGKTYDPALDQSRLSKQLGRVYEIMSDGQWRSLAQIKTSIKSRYGGNDSEASISARLRDLRKPRFGSYQVDRHRANDGLWLYRLPTRIRED